MSKKSIIGFLIILLTAVNLYAKDRCSHVDKKFLRKHLPVQEFEIVTKKPVRRICQVIVNIQNQLIPVYAGKDFVITGRIYNYGNELSKKSIDKIIVKNFNKNRSLLDKAVAFNYNSFKSKTVIYLFTDPLCPYCHRIEPKLKKLSKKYSAELRVVLVPVNGKAAKNKSIEAVCRNFTFKEYGNKKWKSKKTEKRYLCKRGQDKIKLSDALSEKLFIDGVPSFYLENGTFINGADLPALEKALKNIIKK